MKYFVSGFFFFGVQYLFFFCEWKLLIAGGIPEVSKRREGVYVTLFTEALAGDPAILSLSISLFFQWPGQSEKPMFAKGAI
jgi:hypothetical protein